MKLLIIDYDKKIMGPILGHFYEKIILLVYTADKLLRVHVYLFKEQNIVKRQYQRFIR